MNTTRAAASSAVVLASLLFDGCRHRCDLMTMDNLTMIQAMTTYDAPACEEYLQYELWKKGTITQLYDKRSEDNVRLACECIKNAAGAADLVKKRCASSIHLYVGRENDKCEHEPIP